MSNGQPTLRSLPLNPLACFGGIAPLLRLALRARRAALLVAALLLLPAGFAHADDYEEVGRLLRAGNPAAALDRVEFALKDNARDPQLLFMRGVALSDSGRQTEAIEAFTRLTRDYPELPEPYNNLAVLHAAQDRLDEALAMLQAALRARPGYATALDNLGDVHARLAMRAWRDAMAADGALASRAANKQARVREALAAPTR